MKKTRKTGAARAIEGFDNSATAMVIALKQAMGHAFSRQAFERMAKENKPLPAEFVPDVSALTGIPKKELNNDVNWEKAKVTP